MSLPAPFEKFYLSIDGITSLERHGRITPGTEHFHLAFQFGYVLEGTCRVHAAGRTEILHAGEGAFVHALEPHGTEPFGDDPVRVYSLHLAPSSSTDVPERCLPAANPALFHPGCRFRAFREADGRGSSRILKVLARFAAECERPRPALARQDAYRRLLDGVLATQTNDRDEIPETPFRAVSRIRAKLFARFYEADLTPGRLAGLCGMTLRKADSAAVSACGLTLAGMLKEVRLQHARSLLDGGRRSIKEIAFHSGFRHPSHFTRDFRVRFGMTPAEYRRRMRSAIENS